MESLYLDGKKIRVDELGRYCITDLWKAVGSLETKKPSKFARLEIFFSLLEISKSVYKFEPFLVSRGRYTGGTWAVKELAIKYMMWLEPKLEFASLTEISIHEKAKDIDFAISKLKAIKMEKVSAKLESGALSSIEQLLGVTLLRQHPVGKFRIDGYCKETNTAYEIDEPQHFVNGELKDECKERQAYIEKELGCEFVRIKV